MDGGEGRYTEYPQPERAGSPHVYYIGKIGNFSSGSNYGTLNQSAGKLTLSLLRVVWGHLFAPSPSDVEDEAYTASRNACTNTQATGFQIVAIDDHLQSSSRPSGPPPHEIYVRTLLAEGYGLPCWEPQSSEPEMQPNGVVPGDVGTYTPEDGFQRLFNLWDDHDKLIHKIAETTSSGSGYQDLKGNVVTIRDRLRKGEALVRGASIYKRLLSPPMAGMMYEFHRDCAARAGAILALTSSADKEATNDPKAMEEYVKQNAEAIYRLAISLRTIGEDESLYIITGCIKSASWAMAAYDETLDPRHGTLCLAPDHRIANDEAPKYEWRSQGSSRARVGRSNRKRVKDQSLFLQGFKVAFSPRFRDRVKASTSRGDRTEAPGPANAGPDGSDGGRSSPSGREPWPEGNERKPGGGGRGWNAPAGQPGSHNHCLSPEPQDHSISATSPPDLVHSSLASDDSGIYPANNTSFHRTTYHPSDEINAHLLRQTGCDIAICHDESWGSLLKACHPLVIEEGVELKDLPARIGDSGNRDIGIQNGVAFLLPANHKGPWQEAAHGNPRPPPGEPKSTPRKAIPPPKNPEATSKIPKPPRVRLTVVPDTPPSNAIGKRRSYESPQTAHNPKPGWNWSTPDLPGVTDPIPKLRETDVVILVMGMTGSGRSTFINALVPGELPRMKVGDSGSLEATTTAVDYEILDEAKLKSALGFNKSYRLVLVDTPGFNSSNTSDSGVLQDIANWSKKRMPPGGCRGGVIILHNITSPLNERLSDLDLGTIRNFFNMVIATSKWKYESQHKAQKIHDAIAHKWEKPSKKAKFHKFKENEDAQVILGDLLSRVEDAGTRMNFGTILDAIAADYRRREATEEATRVLGWKRLVRALTFWKW